MKEICCCNTENNITVSLCKECGKTGLSVKEITLKNMIKETVINTVLTLDGFYFCSNPLCDVVYFNNEKNYYFHKKDLKVRVGIKEKEEPKPICYCSGWTEKMILDEIKKYKKSLFLEELKKACKERRCECEIKNPSGRCCLPVVIKIVKSALNK